MLSRVVRSFLLGTVVLLVVGCAMSRHRSQVRQGLLTRGLHRDAFVREWGQPSRTFTLQGRESVLRIRPFHGSWGKPMYEVWEYPGRATCLVFDGVRLISWETGKTDCEPKVTTTTEGAQRPATQVEVER